MTTLTVTASASTYTVVVSAGPANPGDWVGLFPVGAASGKDFIDWEYLNGTRVAPPTGMASATLTFPIPAATGNYEFRLYRNNSNSDVVISTPVGTGPPPPAPDGYINVMAYGATGNPGGDDTAAVKAAALVCQASAGAWGSKGLYFPPGGVYVCTQPIDFTGISIIRCEGWLNYFGPVNDVCFKVRIPSQNTSGNYYFFGLTSLSVPYNQMRYPLIQFSGMRGATVRIGACNSFVEVHAGKGIYESTAYSEFHLGQTYRLELHSDAGSDYTSGWINSNQFYGGTLAQLRIGGQWLDVASISGNRVQTAVPHGYTTGNLVEMYNGTAIAAVFGLVTVIDATHFTLAGSFPGTGWRCMGPSGYPHNDNSFWAPDIEDNPAIIHIQGQCNRLYQCRMEATGPIVFGPDTFMNFVEQSNTTHGFLPAVGQGVDMMVNDYSNGKNFVGWVRPPGKWGT